jgi:CRP/FNR family transcriptional regulator, cyclic AMP receptor protein
MSPDKYIVDYFQQQLRKLLPQEPQCRAATIIKHGNIYNCGDHDATVYFIESGQIKLVMHAPEGRECLLAIYTTGDIFGELCLAGQEYRHETATAMTKTVIRMIPCAQFFLLLSQGALLIGFAQYLAVRVAEQQASIGNLVMVDSEQRLGKTLLLLAHKLGHQDPRSTRIEQKISHEELSAMVGTTRPRITEFMRRFRDLGLITLSAEHFLIIEEQKLTAYLASIA